MPRSIRHITQFEIVRFLDGEMSSAEAERLQGHMAGCGDCRNVLSDTNDRLEQLKLVIPDVNSPTLSRDEANNQLKAKLADIGIRSARTSKPKLGLPEKRTPFFRYALAAVAIAAASIGYGYWAQSHSHLNMMELLPDRTLTPGATREVALTEICSSEDETDLDPAVSSSIQKKVFYEYGISMDRSKNDFQVDYLINPQLGGTDDVRNLWPQPYKSTEWNAQAKDALERYLHQMVCERKIDLAEAQHEISTNWIAAYQKYFHVAKPV